MKNLGKIVISLFFGLCIISYSLVSVHKYLLDKFKNIILIGWDGTQRQHIKEILKKGKLPNLQRIIREGILIDIDVTTGDTSTKAGWAEILTGYSPQITGIYNNRTKYKAIPQGYTIFERLEDYFGDENIVTIFLAGKNHNLGTRGPHKVWPNGKRGLWWNEDLWDKKVIENEEILIMESEPYMLTKDHVDFFENGLGKAGKVGPKVLDYIKKFKNDRFFIFVQFMEPDELGHAYGENSIGYTKGLIMVDTWLGKIVDLLKGLRIYDHTLIYIVSDHGFTEDSNEHEYAPETFLATNDRQIKKKWGDRKDITPTILQRYRFNIKKIIPPLEGHSLIN